MVSFLESKKFEDGRGKTERSLCTRHLFSYFVKVKAVELIRACNKVNKCHFHVITAIF